MRGWVCHLQWLLAFASAFILGSESRGTRDNILLSQIQDFNFMSLPTTRRATVEVLYPASTRKLIKSVSQNQSQIHVTTYGHSALA
jgi:hypothetical protein